MDIMDNANPVFDGERGDTNPPATSAVRLELDEHEGTIEDFNEQAVDHPEHGLSPHCMGYGLIWTG